MTSGFPPVLNVAHVAGADGRCVRCKGPIGSYLQVEDQENGLPFVERPWKPGERVIEFEQPNGRTGFTDLCTGRSIDCVP